jgi:6-phosphogluconolactonase
LDEQCHSALRQPAANSQIRAAPTTRDTQFLEGFRRMLMKPAFHESATPAGAATAAADHLLERLEAIRRENGRVTLAVSGGSTPRLMFEQIAKREFDWKDVHIFWVDERCVPPDHADSNYRMTREALLAPIELPAEQVHRIEGELSPEISAGRYVSVIREFFGLAPEELPRFDIVHLGMGSDAHTASLFPGESLILERKHVAASVYSAARDSHRVTLLPGVVLNAAETFFLVTGEDKARPLRDLFEEPLEPLLRPAQLFARESTNVRWFVDRAAAQGFGGVADRD